jgi:hypothetical protein
MTIRRQKAPIDEGTIDQIRTEKIFIFGSTRLA